MHKIYFTLTIHLMFKSSDCFKKTIVGTQLKIYYSVLHRFLKSTLNNYIKKIIVLIKPLQ